MDISDRIRLETTNLEEFRVEEFRGSQTFWVKVTDLTTGEAERSHVHLYGSASFIAVRSPESVTEELKKKLLATRARLSARHGNSANGVTGNANEVRPT